MSLSENDYLENLFQSIDTIIAERIKRLPYDKTVISKIINNDQALQGIYTVSEDDNYKYIAYSDNPTYKVGDIVYVITLSSNINRKFIIGLYSRVDIDGKITRINRIYEQ